MWMRMGQIQGHTLVQLLVSASVPSHHRNLRHKNLRRSQEFTMNLVMSHVHNHVQTSDPITVHLVSNSAWF